MDAKKETHIVTIFKIEELETETERLLVLIPHKVKFGILENGCFRNDESVFRLKLMKKVKNFVLRAKCHYPK